MNTVSIVLQYSWLLPLAVCTFFGIRCLNISNTLSKEYFVMVETFDIQKMQHLKEEVRMKEVKHLLNNLISSAKWFTILMIVTIIIFIISFLL